jgi:hypothetical protein
MRSVNGFSAGAAVVAQARAAIRLSLTMREFMVKSSFVGDLKSRRREQEEPAAIFVPSGRIWQAGFLR